jgi:hypothetical protein
MFAIGEPATGRREAPPLQPAPAAMSIGEAQQFPRHRALGPDFAASRAMPPRDV